MVSREFRSWEAFIPFTHDTVILPSASRRDAPAIRAAPPRPPQRADAPRPPDVPAAARRFLAALLRALAVWPT
jgi:hypothetical protein